jgi:hypothetical protein
LQIAHGKTGVSCDADSHRPENALLSWPKKEMAQAEACANLYPIHLEYQMGWGKVDIFRILFLPIYQLDGGKTPDRGA